MFPISLDEKISPNSPFRLVNQIVDNLDISKVFDTCKGGGTSSYHPRMILKLVLYACLNNIYSCRKIENQNLENIRYMWLSDMQTPDHNTINDFRSKNLKDTINGIFTQVVMILVDMGHLSLDVIYTDGTKIESRSNRYTFVWRKTVEKNKSKLEGKIRQVLEQIEEGIARDNQSDDEPPTPIDSKELKSENCTIKPKMCPKIRKNHHFFAKNTHIYIFVIKLSLVFYFVFTILSNRLSIQALISVVTNFPL